MPSYVCCIGASLVEGLGDEAALGWPGRLQRLESKAGAVFYNLGIRGQSSRMIAERWQRECHARLPEGVPGLVIVSFGNNDVAEQEDGSTRIPLAETLAASRQVIAAAAAWRKTLWIGPVPVDESRMPFYSRLLQANLYYRNERLAMLSAEFAAAAQQLDVPYLDLYRELSVDATYRRSIAGKDGLHPDGTGYQIIAEKISAWSAWRDALAGA